MKVTKNKNTSYFSEDKGKNRNSDSDIESNKNEDNDKSINNTEKNNNTILNNDNDLNQNSESNSNKKDYESKKNFNINSDDNDANSDRYRSNQSENKINYKFKDSFPNNESKNSIEKANNIDQNNKEENFEEANALKSFIPVNMADNNDKSKSIQNSFASEVNDSEVKQSEIKEIENKPPMSKKARPKRFSLFVPEKEIYKLETKGPKKISVIKEYRILVKDKIIKVLDTIAFLLILSNFVLQMMTNNMYTEEQYDKNGIVKKQKNELTDTINYLRFVNAGIIFLTILLVFIRYIVDLQKMRIMNLAGQDEGLWKMGWLKYFFLEVLILIIFTPPYIEGFFEGKMLDGIFVYPYVSIITLFYFPKFYYFLKIVNHYSSFSQKKVQQLAEENKRTAGFEFSFKAYLQQKPFTMLFLMFTVSVVFYMFILRTVEYGFTNDLSNINSSSKVILDPNLKKYFDVFWVVTITMTTVGYGDIYPNTHLGRFVAFFASITGTCIISLMISFLSGRMEFDNDQKKAYALILKNENIDEMKKDARQAIILYFKFVKILNTKRGKKRVEETLKSLISLKIRLKLFSHKMKTVQNFFLPSEKVLSSLDTHFSQQIVQLNEAQSTLLTLQEKTALISENEKKISNSFKNIKYLYSNIGDFLVKINKKIQTKEIEFQYKDEKNDIGGNKFMTTATMLTTEN